MNSNETIATADQLQRAGRLAEAESLLKQFIERHPSDAPALHRLGILAGQSGRSQLACDLIGRAIAADPTEAEYHNHLGNALCNLGQYDRSIAAHAKAIELRPTYAEAYNNLGIALRKHGRMDRAIAAYREAVRLRPDFAMAYGNLGNALCETGQLPQAGAALSKAIALNPNNSDAHFQLGIVLSGLGQLREAIAAYQRALQLNPAKAPAWINLGNDLRESGRLDEAIAAYSRAVALEPSNAGFRSNLIYAMCFHPGYDSGRLLKEHRQWAKIHEEPLAGAIRPHRNDPAPDRKLKIGYVSPDLGHHVVGHNLLPLLSRHDHAQFEIVCYSNSQSEDDVTRQLRSHADQWRNITDMPDETAAQLIRDDGIDLLVDLALHTAYNRLPLFARRPAPIQLTYLGYCGTSGMDSIDYRLSDPYLDPPDADLSGYSERTLRLPHSYWCYEPCGPAPEPKSPPVQQSGKITFGCVNSFAKVSPGALELWGRLLSAVTDSRLLLHAKQGEHRRQALRQLSQMGIGDDRVEFVGKQPWPDYIQTYQRIDISLDPFPYGGGITTCDSLWMGVPVVSLSGYTAVSRSGCSILSNVGLAEFVAQTPDEYVSIAAALAGDIPRLADLRSGLRSRMLCSSLMDAAGFARDVEASYRQAWRRWCAEAADRADHAARGQVP